MNIAWTLTGPWKGHRWRYMFKDLTTHKEINNVFPIERSYDILTYPIRGWKRNLTPPIPLLTSVDPKLHIVRYPLLFPEKFGMHYLQARWLKPIISLIRPDVMFISSPFHIPLALSAKAGGSKVIYFVYDEITYTEDGKPRRDTQKAENKLARLSDAIVVTARSLIEPRLKYEKPIIVRPNGTNTKLWRGPHIEPKEIRNIPHPRIIFHGHMGPWIDHKLFMEMVKLYPQFSFIIVGKISGDASEIKSMNSSNLYLFPFMSQEKVAAMVYHSDVAFMPFKTEDAFSRGINPLKLYEALAAGTPVIISDLPNIPHGPGIHIYRNKDEASLLLKKTAGEKADKNLLTEFATQWDWHNINKELIQTLGGIING